MQTTHSYTLNKKKISFLVNGHDVYLIRWKLQANIQHNLQHSIFYKMLCFSGARGGSFISHLLPF